MRERSFSSMNFRAMPADSLNFIGIDSDSVRPKRVRSSLKLALETDGSEGIDETARVKRETVSKSIRSVDFVGAIPATLARSTFDTCWWV